MARFPEGEAEIVSLAQSIASGLAVNIALYNTSPVSPAALQADLDGFISARSAVTNGRASLKQSVTSKNDALKLLVDDMKSILRYAENTAHYDDAKLKLLGWGGPAAARALVPPGQCRILEAPRQGEGWVFLDWKQPADGGAVASYKIQRRLRAGGTWHDVGLAMESETTLHDQERGKEWEYQVIAVNKAGEGPPSNTVMAVL